MVDWFISHFWGLPFKDFAQSLRTHAMYVDGNWERIRYWMLVSNFCRIFCSILTVSSSKGFNTYMV